MKKWLAGLIACLLLGLAACAEPAQQPGGAPTEPPGGTVEAPEREKTPAIVDKTVDAGRFSLNGFTVAGELTGAADSVVYHNVAEVYEQAPYIVYGTAENIGYWDESGAAHTLYDFVVEKSYKGSIRPGDKITILSPGGYYRLSKFIELNGKERFPDLTEEEIQNTVYKKTYMGAPFVESGEKYVLFLAYNEGIPPFPDGVYDEVGAFQGRFYYKDEDTLTRYTPENEPWFYYDDKTGNIPKQEFTLPELEAEIAVCAQ